MQTSTVFVTLCDASYFPRALDTLKDLRGLGRWWGDTVLVTVDFEPDAASLEGLAVETVSFERIPTSELLAAYAAQPLTRSDGREFSKLAQWEKLHLFEPYFRRWSRCVFLDAGLRVLDDVRYLLSVPWEGRFLSSEGSGRLGNQLEPEGNPEALRRFLEDYGADALTEADFLNCLWILDTALLARVSVSEFIDVMNRYPLWLCNEMSVMAVVLHLRHRVYHPLPRFASNGKYLFDWCELNNPGTRWDQYCLLKYPATL